MMLLAQNISIGYPKKILQTQLNLSLSKGELLCLIGRNGVGKSTLLRTLAGLQPVLAGEIFWQNTALKQISSAQKARLLSMVLTEKPNQIMLSVEEVMRLGRSPYTNWWGKLAPKDQEIIEKALHLTQLSPLRHCNMMELSDGQKQKVMIGRALVQDTPLIFLDEATAHLDIANRIEIFELLKNLAKKLDKSILFSTHELDLALQFADKLCLLSPKQMYCAAPEQLALAGKLGDFFEEYDFNLWQARFEPRQAASRPAIALKGEGLTKLWTAKALVRLGFQLQQQADKEIVIQNENWYFEGHIFQNMEDLLAFLEKKYVFLEKLTL